MPEEKLRKPLGSSSPSRKEEERSRRSIGSTSLSKKEKEERLRRSQGSSSPSKKEKPPALKLKRLQSAYHDHIKGLWRCRFCTYVYQNQNPSARERRDHKKICPRLSAPESPEKADPGVEQGKESKDHVLTRTETSEFVEIGIRDVTNSLRVNSETLSEITKDEVNLVEVHDNLAALKERDSSEDARKESLDKQDGNSLDRSGEPRKNEGIESFHEKADDKSEVPQEKELHPVDGLEEKSQDGEIGQKEVDKAVTYEHLRGVDGEGIESVHGIKAEDDMTTTLLPTVYVPKEDIQNRDSPKSDRLEDPDISYVPDTGFQTSEVVQATTETDSQQSIHDKGEEETQVGRVGEKTVDLEDVHLLADQDESGKRVPRSNVSRDKAQVGDKEVHPGTVARAIAKLEGNYRTSENDLTAEAREDLQIEALQRGSNGQPDYSQLAGPDSGFRGEEGQTDSVRESETDLTSETAKELHLEGLSRGSRDQQDCFEQYGAESGFLGVEGKRNSERESDSDLTSETKERLQQLEFSRRGSHGQPHYFGHTSEETGFGGEERGEESKGDAVYGRERVLEGRNSIEAPFWNFVETEEDTVEEELLKVPPSMRDVEGSTMEVKRLEAPEPKTIPRHPASPGTRRENEGHATDVFEEPDNREVSDDSRNLVASRPIVSREDSRKDILSGSRRSPFLEDVADTDLPYFKSEYDEEEEEVTNEIDTESGGRLSKSHVHIHYDLVRLFREQKRYDLICPVCGCAITNRIIIRKKRRRFSGKGDVAKSLETIQVHGHKGPLLRVPHVNKDDGSWGEGGCFSFLPLLIRRGDFIERTHSSSGPPRYKSETDGEGCFSFLPLFMRRGEFIVRPLYGKHRHSLVGHSNRSKGI